MTDILLHPHDHKSARDWRRILAFLDRMAAISPQSVLELGGGFGNIAFHYVRRGATATVLDTDPVCLAAASARHHGIIGAHRDINAPLPWDDGSFDLVACTGTLHYGYIHDIAAIISEMARVSRRYVLIDILSRYSPYRLMERLYNPAYNPRTHSSSAACALLASYPFVIRGRIGTKTAPFLATAFPFMGKTVYYFLEKNTQ